jgi:hypothetical protein
MHGHGAAVVKMSLKIAGTRVFDRGRPAANPPMYAEYTEVPLKNILLPSDGET